ncbi:MAG: metal-dependent hydrolase [Gammaproteobacteria bacterium]|nr:metal-dependent hydrolase [Gammaproteobacteria bacterium]
MAPDLDVFISSDVDPLLFLMFRRQFTHSLVFIPTGALIVAGCVFPFLRKSIDFRYVYLACLLGYATHGLLDACTSYGTQLFWPFTDYRVTWNNVSVLDPAFTVPLLLAVIAGLIWRRRWLPWIGLTWALTI